MRRQWAARSKGAGAGAGSPARWSSPVFWQYQHAGPLTVGTPLQDGQAARAPVPVHHEHGSSIQSLTPNPVEWRTVPVARHSVQGITKRAEAREGAGGSGSGSSVAATVTIRYPPSFGLS